LDFKPEKYFQYIFGKIVEIWTIMDYNGLIWNIMADGGPE
jgi:hypothetical protein